LDPPDRLRHVGIGVGEGFEGEGRADTSVGLDGILADDAAGVANDLGVAFVEPQHPCGIEPGIHARQDDDLLGRGQGQAALVERRGVLIVVGR
jgi:hypothetical protein